VVTEEPGGRPVLPPDDPARSGVIRAQQALSAAQDEGDHEAIMRAAWELEEAWDRSDRPDAEVEAETSRAARIAGAAECWVREAANLRSDDAEVRARALRTIAVDLLERWSDRTGALEALRRCVDSGGGPEVTLHATMMLAALADLHGDPDAARAAYEDARRLIPQVRATSVMASQTEFLRAFVGQELRRLDGLPPDDTNHYTFDVLGRYGTRSFDV
jgi:hypothetical protein